MENERHLVCLFGAARSGTSMTAHLINEMGVYFGEEEDLGSPSDGVNPEGFFEHDDITKVNSQLVEILGGENGELYVLPDNWQEKTRFMKKNMHHIVCKLFKKPLCGIKENHLSVLFPIWDEIFRENKIKTSYVHIIRHPQSVFQSSYKWGHISEGNCLYTWFCRNRSAMQAARYGKYKMVVYEELMKDPERVVEELAHFLGVNRDIHEVTKIPKSALFHNRNNHGNTLQDKLYKLLIEYGKAVTENDEVRRDVLNDEFSSHNASVASMFDPNEIPMALACAIQSADIQLYLGCADWGVSDTFSIRKTYKQPIQISGSMRVTLATQAIGEYYGEYYEISGCKVNGKECKIEIKQQPKIQDLNMRFDILPMGEGICSLEIVGKVKVVPYPNWYRWGRQIMPLRFREFLRAIGVRKKYGV